MSDSQPTVLVIDDNTDVAEFIGSIVESADCRAVVATDGIAGLSLAQEFSPALILCDLSMPGFGGDEVLRRLQANPAMANVPRVLMSGYGCPDLNVIPADAFIAKPINVDSLRRLVRAFTRSHEVPVAS